MEPLYLKISGTVENVVYRNDMNDYTVLEVALDDSTLVTAVGSIPPTFEGERVDLFGNYTFHKEFGRQFAFEGYEKYLPKEIDGILQYLSSRTVKGIGPVTALKIVNRYGVDTFDVIENHPEWLTDISGITMKKAAAMSESFREQNGIREVMMFCKDFLGTGEITRVYKSLGVGAVGIIRDNPYLLCHPDYGISFDKADDIAKSLGIDPECDERIFNGMLYVLSYSAAMHGHTCLPKDKFIQASAEILEIPEEKIKQKLSDYVLKGRLTVCKFENSLLVMTNQTNEAELYIADKLASLNQCVAAFSSSDIATLIQKVEGEQRLNFAYNQRAALFECLLSGVMILTGGPGTGKTTVIRAMLSIFKSVGFKTVLAAPTGRAAKRMSEATGAEAKTVHRMLEMERTELDGVRFMRNERNPLDERVIIVDEASMLDLSLTEALMRAVSDGARLILIGDFDQLPSVGAGNVLCDLIASECIKTIKLTEIFRQSKESLIVTNAHRINEGIAPILNKTDNDFFFVRCDRESEIPACVADLITRRLPKSYGAGIKDKIQVITPSKKGYGGIEALNQELQVHINPPAKFKKEKTSHGITFREGDKVMQTVNNYEIPWEKNGVEGQGIFNGDIGIIQKIDLNENHFKILYDDRLATYGFDMLPELDLAYSITVHKSQGSEYPVVIIPMYYCAPMLMTRNLLYTAVTRARQMVILIGRSEIPAKMVENNREIMRYTTLKKRISDLF